MADRYQPGMPLPPDQQSAFGGVDLRPTGYRPLVHPGDPYLTDQALQHASQLATQIALPLGLGALGGPASMSFRNMGPGIIQSLLGPFDRSDPRVLQGTAGPKEQEPWADPRIGKFLKGETPADLSKASVSMTGMPEDMPLSTKDPRTMNTSEINRELEELDRLREPLVTAIHQEFKAQGGNPADIPSLQQAMGSDPRWQALTQRHKAVMEEVYKEKVGGVSQRLPTGYERKKMLKPPKQ